MSRRVAPVLSPSSDCSDSRSRAFRPFGRAFRPLGRALRPLGRAFRQLGPLFRPPAFAWILPVLVTASVSMSAAPLAAQRTERRPAVQKSDPVRALGLDKGIDWIEDPETYLDGRTVKRTADRSIDRGAMLDRALAEGKKLGRPVLWYVYRIVEGRSKGAQMYRAPILDGYMQHVLFADEDVQGIIRTRFVPLRMVMDAVTSERLDLHPLEFIEPAVVFLDPESGKVLHYVERIRTFDANWFAELMRRVLQGRGAGSSTPRGLTVTDAIVEGRWDEALAMMNRIEKPTALDLYLRAGLHRRQRQFDAAAKCLADAAGAATRSGATAVVPPGVLVVERMRLLAARGDLRAVAETAEFVGEWTAASPAGPRAAEGMYLFAAALAQRGEHARAVEAFTRLAKLHPDDRWGRKAIANVTDGPDLRPVGPTLLGWEHFGPLPAAAYDGLPRDTTWAGPEADAKTLARQAVAFLLAQQREDGGFTDSRYAYWPTPDITTNTWVAITALAATALHEYRDIAPDAIPTAVIDRAVAKARTFMFDKRHLNRGTNEDVYADTYRLMFLARTMQDAEPGARAEAITRMQEIIESTRTRQKESGFWAHEYPNAFCSAAMLWGLLRARHAGAEIPEEAVTRGLAAVQSARRDDGGFVYGGSARPAGEGDSRRRRPPGDLKSSSGRMPVCEGALFVFGKSTPEKLGFAFETYWKFMDRIERVRRNDFHSDGELAGFFFFHDLFHASDANRLLPEKEQAANCKRFLAILQRIPEMDGSFIDSHEFGRSYGTAMALLTLKNVTD